MQFQRTALQPSTLATTSGIKRNEKATQRYAAEKSSADIQRMLAGKSFSTTEEADAFKKNAMAHQSAGTFSHNQSQEDSKVVIDLSDFAMTAIDTGTATVRKAPPGSITVAEKLPIISSNLLNLERAQDLMYEAWGESGARRIDMARKALEVSSDCADANVLLAQEAAADLHEAKTLFEKAIRVAEKTLGKEVFEEGGFWSRLDTRPYMRARVGLAQTLWLMGERHIAIQHFKELLNLNPDDNQGIRYQLFSWLLIENRNDEVAEVLDSYSGDLAAAWSYNRALLWFRLKGDTKEAGYKLRLAFKYNAHVPPFLLGQKQLPEMMPAYVGFGDSNEAVEYVAIGKDAWWQTPQAIDWLRKVVEAASAQRKHPAHKLWIDCMRAANKSMEEGKFNKAKGQLLYARRQAEKFGEDEFLCDTLSKLVYVCVNHNPQPEDEPLFKKAAQLTEAVYGSDHDYLSVELYHLGLFLLAIKRADEAEPFLRRSLTIAKRKENKHLISSILSAQADVYQAQGKEVLAMPARKESEQIHGQLDDEDHDCHHHHHCSTL